MKVTFFKLLFACSVLFLTACGSLPKHNEIRADDQPTLAIADDGIGSQLYVDDTYLGVVEDGQQIFNISTGNHDIRLVKPNGQQINRKIFVQGNTRREISVGN
ncbi:MAG: hypothetical protein KDF58_13445 [Alphaproteobacteria bacterium]|nr:hypothetical protein [Alphaproteobacteria bacterium]HPF45488.1 hypothetical protein [Emcibacteraceae bacterium]HRW30167.1 hypothetical protein [Emcibacteraceae bacterium]